MWPVHGFNFASINLSWAPMFAKPKMGNRKNCPEKVKAVGVIFTILPTEFHLVYKNMVLSTICPLGLRRRVSFIFLLSLNWISGKVLESKDGWRDTEHHPSSADWSIKIRSLNQYIPRREKWSSHAWPTWKLMTLAHSSPLSSALISAVDDSKAMLGQYLTMPSGDTATQAAGWPSFSLGMMHTLSALWARSLGGSISSLHCIA